MSNNMKLSFGSCSKIVCYQTFFNLSTMPCENFYLLSSRTSTNQNVHPKWLLHLRQPLNALLMMRIGWDKFFLNVGLELRSGLLPKVCESGWRAVWRWLVLQFWSLTSWESITLPKYPQRFRFYREDGEHCTQEGFYMSVFSQQWGSVFGSSRSWAWRSTDWAITTL